MFIDTEDPRAQAATSAIRSGNVQELNVLLNTHPELIVSHIGTPNEARTLLHILADWPGHVSDGPAIATALIDAGADVNAQFVGKLHSETALHWAASNGDVALLDTLLDHGADIDAGGGVIDETPLADARAFLQFDAAHRLIARGAEATLQDVATLGLMERVTSHFGESRPSKEETSWALWNACHGSQLTTAQFLVEMGGDYKVIPPWEDLTPLEAARRSDAVEVVQWLQGLCIDGTPT